MKKYVSKHGLRMSTSNLEIKAVTWAFNQILFFAIRSSNFGWICFLCLPISGLSLYIYLSTYGIVSFVYKPSLCILNLFIKAS